MAATNALAYATMTLADYQHLIPFDEGVIAMSKMTRTLTRRGWKEWHRFYRFQKL
jgi:hypothetical protein